MQRRRHRKVEGLEIGVVMQSRRRLQFLRQVRRRILKTGQQRIDIVLAAFARLGDERKIGRQRIVVRRKRRDLIGLRSEEHTSELQSLMRLSYAVFCLKKTTSTIE